MKEVTGVEPAFIKEAARIYATSKKACIMYSLGMTEHTVGTDNVIAMANLSMVCGHVGKEFSGIYPMRGQNNVRGPAMWGHCLMFIPGINR